MPTALFNLTAASSGLDATKKSDVYTSTAFSRISATTQAADYDVVQRTRITDATSATGFYYYVSNLLLQFNTSSLPDDAIISDATLRFYANNTDNGDNSRELQIEQLSVSTAPSLAMWTFNAPNSVSVIGAMSLLELNNAYKRTYVDIPLTVSRFSPSTTGNTTLRLSISKDATTPTGSNAIEIASYEHTTVNAPQLLITYTVTPPPAPIANSATGVTATSFTANWQPSTGATYYLFDLSTSSTFATFVSGYNSLNVGNTNSLSLTGLTTGTTYYYRVRAASATSLPSANSATISVTTINSFNKTVADTGIAVDDVVVIKTRPLTVTDAGVGQDNLTKTTGAIAYKFITDSGVGRESLDYAGAVPITISDSGVGYESLGPSQYPLADNIMSYAAATNELGIPVWETLADAVTSLSTTEPQNGTQYLVVSGVEASMGVVMKAFKQVSPSTSYAFSLWAKYITGTGSRPIELFVEFFDQDYNFVSAITSTAISLNSAWDFYQISFATPDVVHYLRLGARLINDIGAASAFAIDSVMLRPGVNNTTTTTISTFVDTGIVQARPTNNLGASELVLVGNENTSGASKARVLIQPDLSSLPVSATITDARLRLYANAINGLGAGKIELYKLLKVWNEGTKNDAAAASGETTWNSNVSGTTTWDTPGADTED